MGGMAESRTTLPNRLPYLLMGGHICVDAAQAGLAAVLPFLVLDGGLSYAQATLLVLASNIASAVIQPLFGWLGDKKARPWLMALGVVLAGGGIAAIGLLKTYWLIVLAALISGIGNAMLHPEGGRLANLVGGTDKAVSMSVFSVGGQVGFCLGPVITVAAINAFGLAGTLVYLAFCLPYAAVLLAFNRRFLSFGLREQAVEGAQVARDRWGAFSVVMGALSVRSIVFYGVTSFMPLFIIGTFGVEQGFASALITVFSLAGAVATALSGLASHKVSIPALMVGGFCLIGAAMLVFIFCHNLPLCIAMLMLIAVGTNIFNPPAVALSQSYLPAHLGMASGLSFGVAVAVGGVVSPLLGMVGDAVGLTPVLLLLVAFSAVGLACSLATVRIEKRR